MEKFRLQTSSKKRHQSNSIKGLNIIDQYEILKAIHGRQKAPLLLFLDESMPKLTNPYSHRCAATEPRNEASVLLKSTSKKDFGWPLLNTISFLLSHIAQQTTVALDNNEDLRF
jgi:hypothetical protein